ncbi:hypothetical protein AMS68_001284 [Peltaster fructicola]|uniref:BZIP domain-containing protein n=1 Tax=Peltaster fructicola TaxID=286661 RepID=A0A6H0XLY7_9PEZI|nr:hypothetical protein AMS68_001284 [Peltaster fructicola]
MDTLRDLGHQAVFHNGMVSPPPLDDMMFAPQPDFQFHGNVMDAEFNEVATKVVGVDTSALSSGTSSTANSKNCPPTPSSLSQPTGFTTDDFERSELSSILDRGRKSPRKSTDLTAAAFEQQPRSNKKQRRGSVVEHDGKDRCREKNKIAAAKCRAKKRDNMDLIESSHRTLSAENSLLRRQEQQLRETVAELRTLALDHQNCNCGVHQYNMLEARKLAHGLGGLCSMASSHMPDSAAEQQRKRSCTIDHPSSPSSNHAYFHSRSQSFSAPGQFGMPSTEDFMMQNAVFGGDHGLFEMEASLMDHSKLNA